MDVQKLFKAAEITKNTQPILSEELVKIAQALGDPVGQPAIPPATQSEQPGQPAPLPTAVPAGGDLNPNIKNFGGQQAPSEDIIHKLTFTIAVPPNWGELEIMNELLPVIKTLQEKEHGLVIKGYQFTQT